MSTDSVRKWNTATDCTQPHPPTSLSQSGEKTTQVSSVEQLRARAARPPGERANAVVACSSSSSGGGGAAEAE